MQPIGVIEIFFGSPWSKQDRLAYASFLKHHGFDFYIYGPKADVHLRKHWAEKWPVSYIQELRTMASEYRRNGIKFGVAFSPYGLNEEIKTTSAALLKNKIDILTDIGVEMLGIFFDDMPNAEGLAKRQIEVLQIIRSHTSIPLLFCPTFYSFDPILDRVFGQRSPDYLHDIGESVPRDIEILWTGPKVISDEISQTHLAEVALLLKRKPFICDNLFANDGPKNCKFIKLQNPTGRERAALDCVSHWAFNPMNQSELSKLMLVAAKTALRGECKSEDCLNLTLDATCSKGFAGWLKCHRDLLLKTGLDSIENIDKEKMMREIDEFRDPAAKELTEWLRGKYTVGNECLTD